MKRGMVNVPIIGLSILSLIILVFVGFFLINQFLLNGAEQTEVEMGDNDIDLSIEKVYQKGNSIVVDVKRISGEAELSGIKFFISTGDENQTIIIENVEIENGQIKNFTIIPFGSNRSKIKYIFITPIFKMKNKQKVIGEIIDTIPFNYNENISTKTEENPSSTFAESVTENCISQTNKITCGDQNCGTKINNCGTNVSCGVCSAGQECNDSIKGGTCQSCSQTCALNSYNCGTYIFCNQNVFCGTCLTGQNCNNGICETSCSNSCSTAGIKQCSGTSGYQICGDYDADSCLEWGSTTFCSLGMKCYLGNCVNQGIVRSLVVIVDFQDKKLEDFTGEGVNNVADVESILTKMKSHWEWMSVGRSVQEWDITRITLPHPLTLGELYPCNKMSPCGWVAFRDEIVNLVKQQVDESLYDGNSDGIMDNVFAIVSSGIGDSTNGYNYIMGGASQNQGARIFLDPQGSSSVRDEYYGNFNHEVGHGLGLINGDGLPDIYGIYDTIKYLTLMSSSWPLPAFGFSAYEKIRLGWVIPSQISSTQRNISLLPAETNLQVIKIPTNISSEYFLVEYRKKPSSGFGSSTYDNTYPTFDGLAIYQVNEAQTETNRATPPFLYLRPADGEIGFGTIPEQDDFWYPENSNSTGVFYARRWGSHKTIFRIENIRRSGQSILFDVVF